MNVHRNMRFNFCPTALEGIVGRWIIAGLGGLLFCLAGWSHPLGNFSLNHYTVIETTPGGIFTQHVLDFAEIPSYNELANLDTDGDNKVTPAEIAAYKTLIPSRFLSQYSHGLVDGAGQVIPLVPELLDTEVILSRGEGSLTCLQIRLVCSLKHERLRGPGEKRFVFADHNLTHMRGVREIRVVAHTGTTVHPEGIVTPDKVIPIPVDQNLYVVTGLEASITYKAGEAAKEEGEWNLSEITSMMDPLSIPQFPLETDELGNYAILKSPIQPDQEVQAKISALQPRTLVSASDMLSLPAPSGTLSTLPQWPGGTAMGSPQPPGSSPAAKPDSTWTEMIGAKEISPSFVVMALLLSIVFGASHALSPGHGKTVVAAYLVGSRGTVWHAVFLGIVVTLTHISSVLLLGLITLYFSQYIVPDKLIPLIEAFSGLLIVLIGVLMFLKRYGAYQRRRLAESLGLDLEHLPDWPPSAHSHTDAHKHAREHSHDSTQVLDHALGPDHGHESGHPHSHPHVHEPGNGHDHAHPHEHGHSLESHVHGTRAHPHALKNWLDHEHGPGTHTHDIPADANWRDLLVLGVTGGMVPCPSAIVVLIAAVALQRILFGMLLIVFFSIGLAAVLITIGILMVTAKKFMNRVYKSENQFLWLQILSPVLVTLLGIAIFLRGLQSGGMITFHFLS